MASLLRFSRLCCPQLLFTAILTLSIGAAATTYYVDSGSGNDSASGASEALAWKTIAKVNTQGRTTGFAAGDSILFKRGGLWRETLMVFDPSGGKHSSGTAAAPITFGAYGTGNAPVISGSNRVTGWTLQNGSIWKASLAFTATSFATAPDVVYFDGERGTMVGSAAELTSAKTWYWASNVLYVNAPSNPDSAYPTSGVEVAARDYCIWGVYQCGAHYIVVENLELKNANHKNLIVDVDNNNWTIRNVVAHHNGKVNANDKNNFYLAGGSGHTVSHCRLYEAGANNVNVLECANTVIEWNESYNCNHHCIDMKGGVTGTRPAQDNVIRYNYTYLASGFTSPVAINGIFVGLGNAPGLSNTKVYGNVVSNMTDCGIQVDMYTSNIEVYNNAVMNSKNANYYLFTDGTVVMKNNIALNTGSGYGLLVAVVKGLGSKTLTNNCWYPATGTFAETSADGSSYTMYNNWTTYRNTTGFDANSLNTNPLLVSPSTGDFHLQAASPCINAGVSVGLTKDRDGNNIPQGATPDIGPFEVVTQQADTTPPVITLLGQATMTLEVGTAFTDPGATASDDRDGDVTARIVKAGSVDTAHLGTYTLTYDVSDTAGNAAVRVTRTVRVADTTKPVLSLTGESAVSIVAGGSFVDPGAKATDNYDGDISSRIAVTGTVNAAVAGTYTLTYNVSDSSGNAAAPVTRTINVTAVITGASDTTKPVITLLGQASVTVAFGATYTDAGATAADDRDGDITARIATANNVNTSTPGTYTITYNVSDAAGNAADPVTRTVIVDKPPKPTITVTQ